jgi:hypothetical protein
MTQRYFPPGIDRHAGEKPSFTKKLKNNRARAKASRAQRKKRK